MEQVIELLFSQSRQIQRKLLFFSGAGNLILFGLGLINHRRLSGFIWNTLFDNFY
jgi:hypothetical protein